MGDTTKLRECPFCGGEAKALSYWPPYQVQCTSCGVGIQVKQLCQYALHANENEYRGYEVVYQAILLWNRRACDSMIVSLTDVRDHWKARAEALVRAVRSVAPRMTPCDLCVNWSDEGCLRPGACSVWTSHGEDNWQFDQARFDTSRPGNAPTPPRTNFDAITESPEKLAKTIIEAEYEGFCLDLPECNVPIEIREYSTINCKQCLVDWLNRSVDEQEKE